MIIGISGRARAGKSTVGNYLVRNHAFESIAFSDPMKAFCRKIFAFTEEQLHGDAKELPDPRYDGLTPRRALQLLGTEFGRAAYPDVWVQYSLRAARERLALYASVGVCITDVRFRNERDAIQAAGGKVWRIIRPKAGLVGQTGEHSSENDLTDDPEGYDRIIDNRNGPLEDLEETVRKIIAGRL